jgi:hypothetical protein
MPVRYRPGVAAAVLTVAVVAVAVPVAAFASSPSSPAAAKLGHSPTTLRAKSGPAAGGSVAASHVPAALASAAGISQSRLDIGLAAAKRAGGSDLAGVTAFAQAAGVSHATAQRIVRAMFGTGGLTRPSAERKESVAGR